MRCSLTAALICCLTTWPLPAAAAVAPEVAEQRALGYLAREVPRWSAENKCYSCHNNGDGARALYIASGLKRQVDPRTVADTTDWLIHPERWEHNGGEGEFSDKTLATMQFAATLAAAQAAGFVTDRKALQAAAESVAALQQPNGSWKIDGPDTIGSPATWGRFLATAMSRHTLQQADAERFRESIARADRWLRESRPETVLDAAAVLNGLDAASDEAAQRQRRHCLALIRRGESQDGGWGPYVHSPPEPFDTAIVLLALCAVPNDQPGAPDQDIATMIARGREFLVRTQLRDGSWPETTRPAESISYAQRLSTVGWATRALLVSKREAHAKPHSR